MKRNSTRNSNKIQTSTNNINIENDQAENESDSSSDFEMFNECLLLEEAEEVEEHTKLTTLSSSFEQAYRYGIGDFGQVEIVSHNESVESQAISELKENTGIDFESFDETNTIFINTDDNNDEHCDNENDDKSAEYVLPEEAEELEEHLIVSPLPGLDDIDNGIVEQAHEFDINDFNKVEIMRHSDGVEFQIMDTKVEFKRNYRTTPPIKSYPWISKFDFLRLGSENTTPSSNLNDKAEENGSLSETLKVVQPILDELIKTEEIYVEKLLLGITYYSKIFLRRDLPADLRYKKNKILGNIEQIADFHKNEFLPMLKRNRYDLQQLFDEFQYLIDQNGFYGYVIYTMNRLNSLKLCSFYKDYFKIIEKELNDKLGINSLLLQPIQRMARYPLFIDQFITVLFKNRNFVLKPIIGSCCRLEKKLRTLLLTINESEVINDIVDCKELNVFRQGKFHKVNDFEIFDYTLKRKYPARVFIFDACIIYTEIKGKTLNYRGRYSCEKIGIITTSKSFTLFNEQRSRQKCEFQADSNLIQQWIELIRKMVNSFVLEEKLKLEERYLTEKENFREKQKNISITEDSNRNSLDSGIGYLWASPSPKKNEKIYKNN